MRDAHWNVNGARAFSRIYFQFDFNTLQTVVYGTHNVHAHTQCHLNTYNLCGKCEDVWTNRNIRNKDPNHLKKENARGEKTYMAKWADISSILTTRQTPIPLLINVRYWHYTLSPGQNQVKRRNRKYIMQAILQNQTWNWYLPIYHFRKIARLEKTKDLKKDF